MAKKWVTVIVALLAGAIWCGPARAQRGGGLVFAPIGRAPAPVFRSGFVTHPVATHRGQRHRFASGFGPYLYPDYEPDTVETPPPATEMVAAEPSPAAAAVKPAASVLLELRGDRWVRITNFGASADGEAGRAEIGGGDATAARTSPGKGGEHALETGIRPAGLPKAALVFRDGHTEEIPKYVIVGRTLYTSADYWSTGSWSRKVEISELDVPATLRLNQQRGTKFSLPSGPTEVMMRP
jgi:hypothetical protein